MPDSLLLTDCHLHPFCHTRCLEGMREFAEVALEKGLSGIIFTEHAPLASHWPYSSHFLSPEELPLYLDYADQLKEEFAGRLWIGIGLEIDYHPENIATAEKQLALRGFDHVGLSIHMHLHYWQEELAPLSETERIKAALKHSLAAVNSGLGTGLNHFDFFRMKMPWYDPVPFEDDIRTIFEAMVKNNIALELNPNGWSRFNDSMPCETVWNWSLDYPLRRTVGSDAHRAPNVAQYFDLVKERFDSHPFTVIR